MGGGFMADSWRIHGGFMADSWRIHGGFTADGFAKVDYGFGYEKWLQGGVYRFSSLVKYKKKREKLRCL
jgi:hypothetical protein